MTTRVLSLIVPFLATLLAYQTSAWVAAAPPNSISTFLRSHCYDCHEGKSAEAGLDLTALPLQLETAADGTNWVRIFDRVKAGEMPPPDEDALEPEQVKQFLEPLSLWLSEQQRQEYAEHGRVRARRLTNVQLERSLHDLLGIDIPLASQLPEEPRTDGFTTVADGQSMSRFQLEQHLTVVDAALDEAFRRALGVPDEWRKHLPAESIVRRRSRSRTREPELIDGHAVTWSSRLIFYGRLPATTARDSGWYRFTIRAKALKSPADHGVWCTVRTGKCVSSAPLLGWVGAFEATDKPKEVTFETWLPRGDMLEIRPGDDTLKMARFQGGQVGTGEGGPQNVPGVAIEWIKMERIHHGADNDQVRQFLVGDLSVKGSSGEVLSTEPKHDAAQLMHDFAARAFRRPVKDDDLQLYIAQVHQSLDQGSDFVSAMRTGYRSILCSPRFLYLHEQPGKLDDYAIAARLSYFLWSRMPDDELLQLAAESELQDTQVIREQVERMLKHPWGEQFVKDIADQWLDLSLIDFTEPDRKLYPGFDVIVQQSMLDETHAYLQTMLEKNLSVGHLIDSDFTYLNSRLARYYGIAGVKSDDLQKVALKPEDHRGGLLTQGAILKVTANGTTTSPVIRGVWVSERLLGEQIPPPPANVPAIEPDVRGAKTIREMLAKHKADVSCAACHVKIDPPGFALENYDPSGRWRDEYLQVERGRRQRGLPVDSSFTMPDGQPFENIDEFRQLVLKDRKALARNVAEQLLTYGTGAPIRFADREVVNAVVAQAAESDYGFRSLLHAVATSSIFLTK